MVTFTEMQEEEKISEWVLSVYLQYGSHKKQNTYNDSDL